MFDPFILLCIVSNGIIMAMVSKTSLTMITITVIMGRSLTLTADPAQAHPRAVTTVKPDGRVVEDMPEW